MLKVLYAQDPLLAGERRVTLRDVQLILPTLAILLLTGASKSSIRRFVITEKAPTRAFSWLKAGVDPTVSQHEIGSATQIS